MSYRVQLHHCDWLTPSSRSQAIGAFRQAIEHALGGGPAAVAQAFTAHQAALSRYGGSLPLDAGADDLAAVERWQDALSAGRGAAFIGWASDPEAAAFTVDVEAEVPA